MEKQLAAWKRNVSLLSEVARHLPGKSKATFEAERADLDSLIRDLEQVTERLQHECLPA